MTGTVTALPGSRVPSAEPNPVLIEGLKKVLAMAEEGTLQSFVGTGFLADGQRLSLWGPPHRDIYQMAGSIEWLAAEYRHKVMTEGYA